MRSAAQPAHDFRCRFLARKLAEELLDVLDLERTLFEIVLFDVVFHEGDDFTRRRRRLFTRAPLTDCGTTSCWSARCTLASAGRPLTGRRSSSTSRAVAGACRFPTRPQQMGGTAETRLTAAAPD